MSAPGARQNVVRLEDSLMFNKQSLLMDVGLVQGKRSRVGWSTAWDLVHVGPSVMTDENGKNLGFYCFRMALDF